MKNKLQGFLGMRVELTAPNNFFCRTICGVMPLTSSS